jgi:hypothetical protein
MEYVLGRKKGNRETTRMEENRVKKDSSGGWKMGADVNESVVGTMRVVVC